MKSISRRDFLKLGVATLGSLAFDSFLPDNSLFDDISLARVATTSVSVYQEPSDQSRIVGTWYRDDIVHVYEEVTAETPGYNPVWYRVWGGYMHRARLQKVRVRYNIPPTSVIESGQLAEITVPYVQTYINSSRSGWQISYRLYYSSVHWITGIEPGPDGAPWYRILDELDNSVYYAPATQMRPIHPQELAPITPEIPFELKRIEVALRQQVVRCYEENQLVLEVPVSSGLLSSQSTNTIPTTTPKGTFNIQVKMPSKHMGEANLAAGVEDYVLPGVPWVCFFTAQGHAFHGTYWHDNFGLRMSHGCINMRNEDALWLFRWTRPTAAFEEISTTTHDRKGFGTSITID